MPLRSHFWKTVGTRSLKRFSIFTRVMHWLQARYAKVSPSLGERSKLSPLIEVKAEMMKNNKRIKSMETMIEVQDKLLRTLALKLNSKLNLADGMEVKWRCESCHSLLAESVSVNWNDILLSVCRCSHGNWECVLSSWGTRLIQCRVFLLVYWTSILFYVIEYAINYQLM